MADLTRLRPKRLDRITEALMLVLKELDLRCETRDDLAEVLGKYAPPGWTFVMINQEQQRYVLKAINASPKPFTTLKVWHTVISFLRFDTGEVMANYKRIAEEAEISPQEASKALAQLARIGALIPVSRGRYRMNPFVGWTGSLAKREATAASQPELRLVDKEGG